MRKLTLFVLVSLLLVGIPIAAKDATIESWQCPEGYEGQQLNVFNWSTYIGENTIQDFEAACGVTVIYDVYESDDSLLSRLRQGNPGYDIIVPGDASIPIMIREELLEPIDLTLIPNYANIADGYKNTVFDPENEYSIPYLSGTFGIGYNREAVGGEITSWEQFFNYDGLVAWVDDTRAMIPIGLLMAGFDPNSGDPTEIETARDWLIEHGENVAAFAADDGQELLNRGEVDMAIEYNGDIFQLGLDCECDKFGYSLPVEGTAFSAGFLAIPAGAQNVPLAHIFLDYILDPQVGADIANYTAYPSPNQAAFDLGLIDETMANNPGIYPDELTLERLFYITTPSDAEQLYSFAWDEVKIALSR
ncbi:MAG: spermidine/putrescine ABC transporter substrate-binding protein [Anaerolineae bacterium]|nr:spermidine/putrescine ABC transporter substrate-binding protein [Anaerolineae bacterium]